MAKNAISHRLDVAMDDSFDNYVPGFEDLNVGNATTWLVDGLGSGLTYHYRIKAIFNEGDPTQSNAVSVSTLRIPGEQKWIYETGSNRIGRLALTAEGEIIFVADNGYLYSIKSDSGIQNWRTQLGLPTTVRPSIGSNGNIYASGYAIDPGTGQTIWQNGFFGDNVSIGPDNNLILTSSNSIRAINGETGIEIWKFDQATELFGSSISEQQLIYFAGTQQIERNARMYKAFVRR